MRAVLAQSTVVAITILAVCGCRSSGGGGGWGQKFGFGGSAEPATMSGPELPSANATQGAVPGSNYDYNQPAPGVSYNQAPTSGYPAATAAMPPAYNNAYPATAAAAGGYQSPQNAAVANAAPGYGDPAAAAGAVAPQAGPYNENYGQTSVGADGAQLANNYRAAPANSDTTAPQNNYTAAPANSDTAAPQNNYTAPPAAQAYAPQTPAAPAYQPGAVDPAGTGTGITVTNPYITGADAANSTAATGPASVGNHAPPASDYPTTPGSAMAAAPNTDASYQMADASQGAAGQYGAPPNDGGSSANRSAPAGTAYNPGQTGYAPPGAAPYQSSAATSRHEPYFRPGNTSDYLPSGNSQAPGGPTDRYGVPSTATAPGWPNGY
jgi:hypothetical protein